MPRCRLSVDLESADHAANLRLRLRRASDGPLREQLAQRVVVGTRRLLALFAAFERRATFFVLGEVALRHPALLDEIAAAGHQLAAHGMQHRSVDGLGEDDWRRDLDQARAALTPWRAAWGGARPGYRAPNFSLAPTEAAARRLQEAGFGWSSSLMRARLSREALAAAPADLRAALEEGRPWRPEFADGPWREYPLGGARPAGLPLGWGGGFWLRVLPAAFNRARLAADRGAGRDLHLYIHPWELDLEQPRLALPWWRAQRQYRGMERLEQRLEELLGAYPWGPVGEEED
jgi:polysaccharide deacetylase family protein (PEP-CTERM system associated)